MTEKEHFAIKLEEFVTELKGHVSSDDGQLTVKGFIDVFKNIYTISSDAKIVSKILEIHLFPKILAFAKANKYKVVLAEHQNYYPDISFVKSSDESIRFAVDFKTTYRNPKRPGIYATDLRLAHMAHILKIEPAPKIFSFHTVHIQAISALALFTTEPSEQPLMKQRPTALMNCIPLLP